MTVAMTGAAVLAVSSFSLYSQLGPLHVDARDDEGRRRTTAVPMPREIDLVEFASICRQRLGVRDVEICQIQLQDVSESAVDSLRAELAAAGVNVLNVPLDRGDLLGGTPEQRSEDLDDIERWIGLSKSLNSRYVRTRLGDLDDVERLADRSGLVIGLRRLAERARADGMMLLIENHGGLSSDPDFVLPLLAEVDHDNLGLLLDIGNFPPITDVSLERFFGREVDDVSVDVEHVYERIALMAPHARLVHAKAYDPRSDGRPLLDTDRALGIVAASGYAGSVTVEWEGLEGDPWDGVAATVLAVLNHFPALAPTTGEGTNRKVES